MTPKRILRASAGMNYAYFHTLGAHLKDSHYLSRYDQSVHAAMGKRLLLLQQGVENNYKGDTKTVNEWAAALGVSEWFAWRDFEDVPDNYLGTFA